MITRTHRFFDGLERTGCTWQEFRRNMSGASALTFAITCLPMLAMVGAAVDYSRLSRSQIALQTATDSAALMVARDGSKLSAADLQTKASTYFAGAAGPEFTGANLIASYSGANNTTITLTADSRVPMSLMRIFGFTDVTVKVTTSIALGGSARLRVAMALDNTTSMASNGKLTALKQAATNLVNQIKAAANAPEDAYVSIVPFSTDVNVGPDKYLSGGIDWTDWDTNSGECSIRLLTTRSLCERFGATWKVDRTKWNGCVTDRGNATGPSSAAYDTNVTPPTTSDTASQFPAEQSTTCPVSVLPLGNTWDTAISKINQMSANGNTNQAIGLAHAWATLTGIAPYAAPPPKDASFQYKNVIILLTDGANTQNRWYTTPASIDYRERMTCDNAKAAGITLYTIQVNTTGDPASSVLQYCASDAKKFFLLTSATQLIDVFSQIGTELSQLRIAK